MNKNSIFVFVATSLLLLASLACSAATGGGDTPTQQPTNDAQPVEPTAETKPDQPKPTQSKPAAPSQGAGIACVGTKDAGVVCLDESGWKSYTQDNSQLSSNYITGVTSCPDGRLAFAHYDGISLFDGQNWSTIGKGDFSSPDALACNEKGEFWVAHFQGVSRYDGSQWTKYGSDQLATGDSASELVYDVAIGPDGTVWAVTSNSVAAFAGEKWTIYQQGQGFDDKLYFNQIAFDAQGRPVVSNSNGVVVFEDGKWTANKNPDYVSTVEDLTIDTNGRIWLGTSINGLYTLDNGAWSNTTFSKDGLGSNEINSLAADASGRVWAATSYGLSVFNGDEWQTFRMDNADIPANDLRGIAVLADGPKLPDPIEKATGGLTGQVKNSDGSPVANSTVEICVEIIGTQFFGDTPCSDQPFFLSGETDDKGAFTFENVPTGYYTIVMKVGDGWAQLTGEIGSISEQVLIEPDQTNDIGDITIEK